MINLIPNKQKKKMIMDFYIRLTTVFFVMFGISALVLVALVFPSYFMSMIKIKSINESLVLQDSELASFPDQNISLAVKDLEKKVLIVEGMQKNKNIFSQKVLNEVLLEKTPSIKITGISFKEDLKNGDKIEVRGKAKNRDALSVFRNALEDNVAFSKVELPISSFVKDSDLVFSLILTSPIR